MVECKDCVHNKVCAEVNSLKCRKDFIWYDAKSGCPYYTADVVPKSEVDGLKQYCSNREDEVMRLLDANEELSVALREAERKVAREIIREIETCMKDFEDDDDGYLLKKCEFEFFMREIRDKYTEN